jgi:hypothetical protein
MSNIAKARLIVAELDSLVDIVILSIHTGAEGKDFQQIYTMAGMGDSEELVSYQYRDRSPLMGMNYYRLKQVDFDGAYEYSKIVSIQLAEGFQNQVRIYPNPSNGSFTIQLDWLGSEGLTLKVVSLSGRTVVKRSFSQNESSKPFDFGQELEPGLYLILLEADGQQFVSRILKQ